MAQLENFRLKVFRAVAEHLNFHHAAEHLFLTQPAVTLQIKALENDLGVRLFDRAHGGITLTRQGSVLLNYANKVADLVAEAERELGKDNTKVSGELPLGVSTTIAQYVLPQLLPAFLDEHPRIQVLLHSGNTRQVVHFLLDGKIPIGLIEGPSRERGIHVEPFMEDELVLIAPRNFENDHLSPSEFLQMSLLMREHGSGSRRVVEQTLEKAGFRLKSFRKIVELDSTEAIKSSVDAGFGVGFVSRCAIADELELGRLKVVQVGGIKVCRHFALIMPAGPEPHGPAGALRTFALLRAPLLFKASRKPFRSASSRR
jgi:LysR family transcriptional regulator, transcriptional activator of the cysJI operon